MNSPVIFIGCSAFLFTFQGAGYAIGEVVSLSVNRKRGKGLATVAGIAVVISYLVSLLLPLLLGLLFGRFHILDLLALGLGIFIAASRLR